jgi:type III pantothenate kinase
MILSVDVGNSHAKFALVDEHHVDVLLCTPTAPMLSSTIHVTRVVGRLRKRMPTVEAAVFSSVVPGLDRGLKRALGKLVGLDVIQIDHTSRLPFRLDVRHPEKLGGDRICAAAGTVGRSVADAIVIDIGSAVTVDFLHRGAFKGGVILAGPALGLAALAGYAKRLPNIPYRSIERYFPTRFNDTEPSMILGAHLGTVGAVKEAVRQFQRIAGRRVRVFATGGGAASLSPRTPRMWRLDPYLVLKGIHRVWVHGRNG